MFLMAKFDSFNSLISMMVIVSFGLFFGLTTISTPEKPVVTNVTLTKGTALRQDMKLAAQYANMPVAALVVGSHSLVSV